MFDLEIAKQTLKERNLTLAVVKNGKIIFQSNSHGIIGFLEAIEQLGGDLEGAAVADKIVGKAAALLCAYSRVNAVFASTLSLKGKDTLEKNGIKYEYEVLVSKILDKSGKDMCPFEKFSSSLENPKEAYFRLKEFSERLHRKL
ncbi:hypothetical protein DRO54_05860 [Candidatus Bathyarchaeota archaeon]|nr:MAG: hypothetical protein DRO54_05860 [Candidatus Bathyarchaeota archaeon]